MIILFIALMFSGSINFVTATSDFREAAVETVREGTVENDFREGLAIENAKLINPLDDSISSIPAFFKAIIEILMIFAIPFIVFFIIYAGFLYVTARGNAEAIQKAHRALLYALLGGLLILGASLLLNIITGTVEDIVKK